jgi:hypothetical protein
MVDLGQIAEPPDSLAASLLDLCVAAASALAGDEQAFAAYQGLEHWVRDADEPDLFRRTSTDQHVLTTPACAVLEALPEWSTDRAYPHRPVPPASVRCNPSQSP